MTVIKELKRFYKKFKGEKGVIGRTQNNAKIYYFALKKTEYPKIIITYSIHAREYITTYLALKQIKDFARFGKRGCVYFVPMINIDGVKKALSKNPLYKANARGVDLNVNFDARWGKGEKNVRVKGAQNYIGTHPFSESETRAIRDFTLMVTPQMSISYHSKGEEIYWEFFQEKDRLKRDFAFAKLVSNTTGYPLKSAGVSAGGYKDWCIEKLGIVALTIEVGKDSLSHPIKKENLEDIYQKNKKVVFEITESPLWN